MPRGQLTKNEIKVFVLGLKNELHRENHYFTGDPKEVANRYLNKVLDKLDEYAY